MRKTGVCNLTPARHTGVGYGNGNDKPHVTSKLEAVVAGMPLYAGAAKKVPSSPIHGCNANLCTVLTFQQPVWALCVAVKEQERKKKRRRKCVRLLHGETTDSAACVHGCR